MCDTVVQDGWAVLHDGDEIKLLRVSIPGPCEMDATLPERNANPDCRVFQGADLKFLEIELNSSGFLVCEVSKESVTDNRILPCGKKKKKTMPLGTNHLSCFPTR